MPQASRQNNEHPQGANTAEPRRGSSASIRRGVPRATHAVATGALASAAREPADTVRVGASSLGLCGYVTAQTAAEDVVPGVLRMSAPPYVGAMNKLTKTLSGLAVAAALSITPAVAASAAPVPNRVHTFVSLSDCDRLEASLKQRGHHITQTCRADYNQYGSWMGTWSLVASVRPVGTP